MKRFFIFLILIFFFIFLYAYFIDTSGLAIKEYKFESSNLPLGFDGFKIVQFSDLLYKDKNDLSHLEEIVNEINNLNPDIIVFTGDLLKNKISDKDKNDLINILKALKPELFKYAIAGDNDPSDIKEIFEEANFIFLENEAVYLFNEDIEPIVIAGGSKITEDAYNFEDELDYNFVISLIHEPDKFDKITLLGEDNLVLAGHSLGGQIRLPFWGATIRKKGAKTYLDDYYPENFKTMYVSYGIGTEKYPFRFMNKPSINVYRLYKTN